MKEKRDLQKLFESITNGMDGWMEGVRRRIRSFQCVAHCRGQHQVCVLATASEVELTDDRRVVLVLLLLLLLVLLLLLL